MLNRRTMMAAGPIAAAGLTTTAQAQMATSTPPAISGAQAAGWYRYKVGDVEVTAIHDGVAQRPLEGLIRNAELADVKAAMAEAFMSQTALPITFTTLVLKTAGKTVLIDTGNGDSGAPTTGQWMRNFRAAGFDPATVDSVIISHFHGDHINGLRLKDGTAVFPKAEVSVPEAEWAFWTDDARMASAPDGLKPTFAGTRRVFGPMMKDVKTYAAGKEVAPGLTSISTPGHTPGHMSFMLASGAAKLLVMSDITNHPALFVRNPNWSAVFDTDADMARATRHKALDMAASERAQVAFYHAPFPATGFIAREGDRYRFTPAQWNPAV